MITIGFSKPVVAKYSSSGNTVTYSDGMALGRGVSVEVSVEASDDNNFYADNVIAESDAGRFVSGSLATVVDGLNPAAADLLFALPEETEINGVKMVGYNNNLNPQHVGFGFLRLARENGADSYWPVVLPKVKFALPSETAETNAESINWQTQDLAATILRDDTAAKNWKLVTKTGYATEDEAYAVLCAVLGIPAAAE